MSAQSATAMQATKGSVPVRQRPADLFEDFDEIYDAITRKAFHLFEGDGRGFGRDLENWLRAERELLHPLPLEVRESESDFTIEAETPGFTAKDLEISVEPRCLKIAGRRENREEEKKGRTIRSEWSANQVLRAVDLPADVDTSKVTASLKNGVLTIDLPKAPHAKSVRVEPRVL